MLELNKTIAQATNTSGQKLNSPKPSGQQSAVSNSINPVDQKRIKRRSAQIEAVIGKVFVYLSI